MATHSACPGCHLPLAASGVALGGRCPFCEALLPDQVFRCASVGILGMPKAGKRILSRRLIGEPVTPPPTRKERSFRASLGIDVRNAREYSFFVVDAGRKGWTSGSGDALSLAASDLLFIAVSVSPSDGADDLGGIASIVEYGERTFEMSGGTPIQRAVLVLTKCDALGRCGLDPDPEAAVWNARNGPNRRAREARNETIKNWASEFDGRRFRNLIENAERSFVRVDYAVVGGLHRRPQNALDEELRRRSLSSMWALVQRAVKESAEANALTRLERRAASWRGGPSQ